jgi:hypothetical protein
MKSAFKRSLCSAPAKLLANTSLMAPER